jgi:hypothetical protein
MKLFIFTLIIPPVLLTGPKVQEGRMKKNIAVMLVATAMVIGETAVTLNLIKKSYEHQLAISIIGIGAIVFTVFLGIYNGRK